MGGVVQEIFQGRGGQTRHGGRISRLLLLTLLLVSYAGLLFDIPSKKPVLWFCFALFTAVLHSFLSFVKRKKGYIIETLSSYALLVSGLIQFLDFHWLHIIYIPFLVFLSLFWGPRIMIPLSFTVPLLEVRHFIRRNCVEELVVSAAAILTAALLSTVFSRVKRERDMAKKSLLRLKEEAEDIDSGKSIDALSSEILVSQHLSSTNKTNEEVREILSLAAHLLSADSVRLYALKGNTLTFRCSSDGQQEGVSDKMLLESCVRKRASVMSGAVPSGNPPFQSNIVTPVVDGSFITGVLSAHRVGTESFDRGDIKTLEIISQQVVKILRMHRIYSQISREHAGLKILHEGSSSLITSLKLHAIAQNLIEVAYRIAPLSIALFVSRGSRHELIHQVGIVTPEERFFDFSNTLVGMAIRNREPIYFSDLKDKRVPALPFKSGRIGSIFTLPLIYEKELLGILVFLSESEGALTSYQLELLKVLGNQAASSLENAKLYSEIEQMAVIDGLTGLYNHRSFQDKLSGEFNRWERLSDPLSLLLVDIDFFKKVNDTYGHPAGDEILRSVAEIIKESVRNIDVPARYGGEEFAAILPGTDREGARKTAERLRKSVMDRTFPFEEKELKMTVSIGAATSPDDAKTKEELIEKADRALYHAKRNGRNRCVFWEDIKNAEER